jgi:hypothetical protein
MGSIAASPAGPRPETRKGVQNMKVKTNVKAGGVLISD